MIEAILDKVKRRGASAEVFLTESAASEISFESGKLKNAEQKTVLGIGLRVIREGRIGFSSTTDPHGIERSGGKCPGCLTVRERGAF